MSFREWLQAVERLVQSRLQRSINTMELPLDYLQEAWRENASPEEFYEVDIIDTLHEEAIRENR